MRREWCCEKERYEVGLKGILERLMVEWVCYEEVGCSLRLSKCRLSVKEQRRSGLM